MKKVTVTSIKKFNNHLGPIYNDNEKNIIPYSCFVLLSCNWVKRKLPMISRHVDFFMLHVFYVLNVIMVGGEIVIFLEFVVL